MNILQATKGRIQLKFDDSSVYLIKDAGDTYDGSVLCLSNPSMQYYEGDVLHTSGEYDIKGVMIFGFKLSDQIVYHLNGEEINVVYIENPLSVDSHEKDLKKLESIARCDILVTNISAMKDLSPILGALTPKIVCVTESFDSQEGYEKMKTFKIKTLPEASESENAEFIVLQK